MPTDAIRRVLDAQIRQRYVFIEEACKAALVNDAGVLVDEREPGVTLVTVTKSVPSKTIRYISPWMGGVEDDN